MSQKILLRQTKSICPECYRKVDAQIIEEDSKVFMTKCCPRHGEYRIVLSNSPSYYRNFEKSCSPFVCKSGKRKEIEIILTLRCNMDCSICYLGDFKKKFSNVEPTLSEIEKIIIENNKIAWRFILTGGEPTLREDLFEIIKILKKYKKGVIIATNGIRLADLEYVRKLKAAGVDRINIQFDGFDEDTERNFRGDNYIPIKIKALQNLKEIDIPVGTGSAIWRGMNEKQVSKLLDFATNNSFIKSIGWCGLAFTGGAKNYSLDSYTVSDQAIDIIEAQTKGKISKKSVMLFTKLFLTANVFFDREWSRYARIYLLIKKKGDYEPIDSYINLQKMEPYMDKFFSLYLKDKLRGRLFFILGFPIILFVNMRFSSIIKELIILGTSFFTGRKHYLNPSNMLYIRIANQCDVHNFDSASQQCCYNIYLKVKDKIHKQTSRGLSVIISRMSHTNEKIHQRN